MITLKDVDTEFLIKELINRGYIRVLWHEDDIKDAIKALNKEPTPDAIASIKEDIEGNFDASIGINWDVIGVYVHDHFNPRDDVE